jgi:hypothetical protein
MQAAIYEATNWATGKTRKQIEAEIQRIKDMWKAGRDFQFPHSAHYQNCKIHTLEKILDERAK